MRRFEFPLASVLQLRRNERDLLRREFAELLKKQGDLSEQKGRVSAARLAQIAELRDMTAGVALDVEANLSRRAYADWLSDEVARLEGKLREIGRQIDARRSALLDANQRVETLEKLEQKRLMEFIASQERRDSLQQEDVWQAQRATQPVTD